MAARMKVTHPSVDERRAQGKEARNRTALSSHAEWTPARNRPDPAALLEEQNRTREPDLVPVRHGRMLVSPFTFYRGAAKIMAADLKDTPGSGAATPTCPTSGPSPRPRGSCCSAYTTSTRPSRGRSNTT